MFSAYYALQTATRRVRHRRGPARERPAVERGRAGALQGRRRQRARSAGRPERARQRTRAAGGRAARLERLAGAAGARRRRSRSQGRDVAPPDPDTTTAPPDDLFDRALLALSLASRPLRRLREEGPAQAAARAGHGRCRRAARGALRARGHRHRRADPDRRGPGAGERTDRADRVPRGPGREEGAGALRARPAAVPGGARSRPRASWRATTPRRRTRRSRPSATRRSRRRST